MLSQCLKKRKYKSLSKAEEIIKRAYDERGHKLRAYTCHICNGIHLTHKPLDKKPENKLVHKDPNYKQKPVGRVWAGKWREFYRYDGIYVYIKQSNNNKYDLMNSGWELLDNEFRKEASRIRGDLIRWQK